MAIVQLIAGLIFYPVFWTARNHSHVIVQKVCNFSIALQASEPQLRAGAQRLRGLVEGPYQQVLASDLPQRAERIGSEIGSKLLLTLQAVDKDHRVQEMVRQWEERITHQLRQKAQLVGDLAPYDPTILLIKSCLNRLKAPAQESSDEEEVQAEVEVIAGPVEATLQDQIQDWRSRGEEARALLVVDVAPEGGSVPLTATQLQGFVSELLSFAAASTVAMGQHMAPGQHQAQKLAAQLESLLKEAGTTLMANRERLSDALTVGHTLTARSLQSVQKPVRRLKKAADTATAKAEELPKKCNLAIGKMFSGWKTQARQWLMDDGVSRAPQATGWRWSSWRSWLVLLIATNLVTVYVMRSKWAGRLRFRRVQGNIPVIQPIVAPSWEAAGAEEWIVIP